MTLEYFFIGFAVAGALTFCIYFPASTDVRQWTREGRHMWALTFALLALGGVSILRRLVGEWPHYDTYMTVIYALIGLLLWQRVLLLYQARRDARRRREERAWVGQRTPDFEEDP